jgi:predicted deacylase
MPIELPARGVRIGGVTVAPGEAHAIRIPIASAKRAKAGNGERHVPAWVAVGAKPGPRVTIVAARRGIEVAAARAAGRLAAALDPAELAGSVVIVPVLRPRGQLARTGRARNAFVFPGDAGGDRAARDAFALFSDLAIGTHAIIALGAPRCRRRGVLVARGHLADPRVRRLAMQSGAHAVLPTRWSAGHLLAAAAEAHVVGIDLSAGGEPGDASATETLVGAVRALLVSLGVLIPHAVGAEAGGAEPRRAPLLATHAIYVRAPSDGFLEAPVAVGGAVRVRALLGRVVPLMPGASTPVVAPINAMVLEAAAPGPVRAGANLFALVPLGRAAARREPPAMVPDRLELDGKTRVGWIEHVGLPGLEVSRLKAKIDTGARTSALHVTRMRTVDTDGGPNRRPILEIAVPSGRRGLRPKLVRAVVRRFVVVRDTSGRMERRPVIETALKLGPIERRISVTLTNRGDMLFPMLVGRTALGPGVVVDPSRPYLLGRA